MEHKLILGGEVWLPFARSRIKSLKATGIRYGDQKFSMPDGATVWVKIEPGYEYIKIIGESPLSYLLWPTSDQNIGGVFFRNGQFVDPHIGLALNTASVKVELDCTRGALPQDWVSDDGGGKYGKHLITYDSGAMFRYQFANMMDVLNIASTTIFADGVEVETTYGVRGACLSQPMVNGVKTPQIVYASTDLGYTSISLHHFSPPPQGAVDFVAEETTFYTYTPGGSLFITHPVFFDGLGTKFVTVSETWDGTKFDEPRYRVRGAIDVDNNGVYTLTVTTAPLGMEAPVNTSTTIGSFDWVITRYGDLGSPQATKVGSLHTVVQVDQLIGLDMSIDGQEMLITRRQRIVTQDTANGAQSFVVSWLPGPVYREDYATDDVGSLSETTTRTISINAEEVSNVELLRTYVREEHRSGYQTISSGSYSTSIITIDEDHPSCVSIYLKDVDARFRAVATYTPITHRVRHRSETASTGSAEVIEDNTIYDNFKGTLRFKFQGDAWEKEVDNCPQAELPTNIYRLLDTRPYRLFASRRKGELVANVAMILLEKYASGSPDTSPITVLKKGNVTHTITSKRLGLGQADTGVSFYPVLLLF